MGTRGLILTLVVALAAALGLLWGFGGCATPGADPAAQLLTQNVAVRNICIDLLDRQRLSTENGQDCLLVTNQVRDVIDLHRLGKVQSLEAARQALIDLERRLQAQEADR